eukprot:3023537-Amphidinium_carterae.1
MQLLPCERLNHLACANPALLCCQHLENHHQRLLRCNNRGILACSELGHNPAILSVGNILVPEMIDMRFSGKERSRILRDHAS